MAAIQHFSVSAGDDAELYFTIDTDTGITINGAEVLFEVFPQAHGIPDKTDGPIISKSTGASTIAVIESPPNHFLVSLVSTDTVDLLHNYYFEAKVVDVNGNNTTVTKGLMCVTEAQIAPV